MISNSAVARSLLLAAIVFSGLLLNTGSTQAASSSGGLSVDRPDAMSGPAAFPVRGSVSWGDGLGAGRGHQGQDLLARCTIPVVAAQTGRVTRVSYQASGAGNYAVVRGTRSRFDYVYMHMLRRPDVRPGQVIRAGQRIGLIGSTGRSSACHLHFEMWTRPGWYQGGSVANPTPYLRKWRGRR